MKMSKKQQYRSFSKRLTRRIMLALTLALIVVAAFFNWIEADVFTHYYKVYCKILLDVKNATIASASSSPSSLLCSTLKQGTSLIATQATKTPSCSAATP